MEATAARVVLDDLRRRYPQAKPPSNGYQALHAFLARSTETDDALEKALREHLEDFDRFPTGGQLETSLQQHRKGNWLRDHQDAVRAIVAQFGHDVLALEAVPAESTCETCTGFGLWSLWSGRDDDQLLRHVHIHKLADGDSELVGHDKTSVMHAWLYCMTHAPGGAEVKRYHPLVVRMTPKENEIYQDGRQRWQGNERIRELTGQVKRAMRRRTELDDMLE